MRNNTTDTFDATFFRKLYLWCQKCPTLAIKETWLDPIGQILNVDSSIIYLWEAITQREVLGHF